MEIKVKKLHSEATLPRNANFSDAGYDLVAIDDGIINDNFIEYRTGIAIQPPIGYHTEIFPRSSITKYDLVLKNSAGIIDLEYTGELICRYAVLKADNPKLYKKGDRIAQLLIRKTEYADFIWVEELKDTRRGNGGFGSSGR